jgi:type I restriction enzyme S subunit
MSDELPQGWIESTVGETSEDISYGYTAKSTEKETGPRYLRITDIQNGNVNWSTVPFCSIPKSKVEHYSLSAGDIVFARTGATTGKSFLIKENTNAVFASYLIRVRPSRHLLSEFIAYFFQTSSYWNQISENISGSAQPNCNATKLATLELSIPPLPEQRRIVAKLEKLLDKVNASKKHLERIPQILKRFRQSVLAAACSGKLTEDWREENKTVESGIDLLNRVRLERQSRVSKKAKKKDELSDFEFHTDQELPRGWASGKLENLIYIAGRIGWRGLKAEEYTKMGPMLLSVYNLNYGVNVDFTNVKHISQERYDESPEIRLRVGDILLAKDGAGIGKLGFVNQLPAKATVNSSILVIRSLETFAPKYLFYFLSGPELQNLAKTRITGSATPHLFQKDIKQFFLSVPSLDEQQEIVRRVEALFALADQIEARYTKAKAHVNKLTQSILAKAFRGELVPQDPNDPPASELLERIKAEKARTEVKESSKTNKRLRRAGEPARSSM